MSKRSAPQTGHCCDKDTFTVAEEPDLLNLSTNNYTLEIEITVAFPHMGVSCVFSVNDIM